MYRRGNTNVKAVVEDTDDWETPAAVVEDNDDWGTPAVAAASSQSSNTCQNSCSQGSRKYSSPPRKSILKKRRVSTQQHSKECNDCIPVSNVAALTCADPTTRRHDHTPVSKAANIDKVAKSDSFNMQPARERFYQSRCGNICKKLTPRYPRQEVKKIGSSSKSIRGKNLFESSNEQPAFEQSPSQTPEILVKVTPENYKIGLQIGLFDESQRLSPVNLLAEFLTCDDSKNDSKNSIDSENENDLRSHSSSEGYGTQKDPFQLSSRAFDDKSAPFSSPKYSQRQQKEYGNFQSAMPSKSEEVINEYIHTPSTAVPSKYRQYSSVRRSHQRYDQKPGNQSRPYY